MRRLLALAALLAAIAFGAIPRPIDAVATLPACSTEDAPGPCYWDAQARGNGIGTSFWVDADQVVHTLP